MCLTSANIRWLQDFIIDHGRAPKVLHIGNIANNAYINAKLMISAGLDCDVLVYDQYHIMGCPEWEEADFSGVYGSDFRPSWHAVILNGFKRPGWFVQGPLDLCLKYLLAKRENTGLKDYYWRRILVASGCIKSKGIGRFFDF